MVKKQKWIFKKKKNTETQDNNNVADTEDQTVISEELAYEDEATLVDIATHDIVCSSNGQTYHSMANLTQDDVDFFKGHLQSDVTMIYDNNKDSIYYGSVIKVLLNSN